MKSLFRFSMLLVMLLFAVVAEAQQQNYREMHKVKKGETLFGIARRYEITVDQLIKANPDMNAVGYELKKGDYIFIPYPDGQKPEATQKPGASQKAKDDKTVRVGIMLPLHNVDGDGRRMIEYYRGFLMGCDELKKAGQNVEVMAWNVPIDANISQTLAKEGADRCDVIFGPLYSAQVAPLAAFAKQHGIKMVIPFSITGNEVEKNPNVFQVYQSPQFFAQQTVKYFIERFQGSHVVVVDCNDAKSDKGVFTMALRMALAEKGMTCSITNLSNSGEYFSKAFSRQKPNVVVLNTGRSPELNTVIAKLDQLKMDQPGVKISLFGYTDWLMYAKYNLDKFCKYDTYIPTHFYYNPLSSSTQAFEREYRLKFDQSLMDYQPRFAITGHDHALFFIRGISKKGRQFLGTEADSNVLQTQLHFKKAGSQAAGMQNVALSFVHYNTNHSISIINY
jgi:ABC-type branched-subunit amino acid transport system substrate-binding protein